MKDSNEDSHFAAVAPECYVPLRGLLVVADGISGGYGSMASNIAVDAIRRAIAAAYSPLCGQDNEDVEELLTEALRTSDAAIRDAAVAFTEPGPTGTTCVAALLLGDHAIVAGVGDSRAYLYHDGRLHQVTVDQVKQEDGRLANWLGGMRESPTIRRIKPTPGDRLLLCSDGLCRSVGDARITSILAECEDSRSAVVTLLDKAVQFGSEDDATAAVACFSALDERTSCQETAESDISRPSTVPQMLLTLPVGWIALAISVVNTVVLLWMLFLLFYR